jgi:hypothetical protein
VPELGFAVELEEVAGVVVAAADVLVEEVDTVSAVYSAVLWAVTQLDVAGRGTTPPGAMVPGGV